MSDVAPAGLGFAGNQIELETDCESWPMTCWTPPEDETLAHVLWEAACDAVWALTGRRVGVCLRRAWVIMPPGGGVTCLPRPMLYRRQWFDVSGSWDTAGCCELPLPGPIVEVVKVQVDGADVSSWERRGDTLWWTGGGCWPSAAMPCITPRIYIEWRAGHPAQPICQLAAAELATELQKACGGDLSCRLPSNIVNLTRQGITINFIDPAVLLDAGLWGLPRVDAAIRTINPAGLPMGSAIFSPDAPRIVRA